MTSEHELDALRREARTLRRAVANGDPAGRHRAIAVLGARIDERFLLADALHVVAREGGAISWPSLVAAARRGQIRTGLDEEADENGIAEIDVETGLQFPDGTPVTIAIRRRGRRLMLDDRGAAVRRGGRRRGWLEIAGRAVEPSGMNVARTTGTVFVPAWDNGRSNLERLADRLARASLDVYEALLELE
ncbi:MAG TPA: hypothetical protein VGF10_04660 [Gaiella sp.]